MRAWLRFFRVPMAPTAAWDSAACLALALTAAGRTLGGTAPLDWLVLALTSLALYAFGMGLNDLADRDRDARLAPDRPLPSGAIDPRRASVLVMGFGGLAVALGGGPMGFRPAAIAAVVFAALYDLALKRSAVGGAVSMGLVRFSNASLGVWPLVLGGRAPWWTLLAPVAVGLYSAAITVWSTTEDLDVHAGARRRLLSRVLAISAFALAGVLPWIASERLTLGLFIAGGVISSLAFARTPRAGPPKRQVLEMLLGLYFLSMAIATGAEGGSMPSSLVALAVALGLIYLSQRLIRALGPRPATRSP